MRIVHSLLSVPILFYCVATYQAHAGVGGINAVKHEIYNPAYSYKVLALSYVDSHDYYVIAGTYSMAEPNKGQAHVDGVWVKKVTSAGEEVFDKTLKFKQEPKRVLLSVGRNGSALVFVEDDGGNADLYALEVDYKKLPLSDDFDISFVSNMYLNDDYTFWLYGAQAGRPLAVLVDLKGDKKAILTEEINGYIVNAKSSGKGMVFIVNTGNKREYYKGRSMLISLEVVVNEKGNMVVNKRELGLGKFADVSFVDNRYAYYVDRGVGVVQEIVLLLFEGNDKRPLDIKLHRVELGLEPFSVNSLGKYWVLSGTEKNRPYVQFVSKSNSTKVEMYRDGSKMVTINNRVACGLEHCLVVGTRINLERNKTIRNRVSLLFLNVEP